MRSKAISVTGKTVRKYPRAFGLLLGFATATALGIFTPFLLYGNSRATSPSEIQPSKTASDQRLVNGELKKGTPDYKTILPTDKTIEDYGGWTRVSPPASNPVFAYVDTIDKVPIRVSQQPLPKEFADQPTEQIQLLALGYSANKKIAAGPTTVFVGTSAKGPQSVIFTKSGLLVLIKASAKISDEKWSQYVQSLGN